MTEIRGQQVAGPVVTEPDTGGGDGGTGPGAPGGGDDGGAPSASGRRGMRPDAVLRGLLHGAAWIPLTLLLLILVALAVKAWPAIRYNGFGFFGRDSWNPGNLYANLVTTGGVSHPPGASYGALPLVVGTVVSSLIALVVAVPVAVGMALVVVEKLPPRLSSTVGFCLELLAGVPSVVIGLWGFLTFGPFLSHHVATIWANHVPDVPVLRYLRGPTGNGQGMFTAGLVLAMMILPIIAATSRDLLRQVPRDTVDGALALGMTDAEAVGAVTIPWVRTGIIGASMLGLGRALGETIAIAMVSGSVLGGNAHTLYQSFTTIAATIVTQLDSALTDASGLATATLAEVGLVLLVITLLANIAARMLVRRVSGTALPVGRGI